MSDDAAAEAFWDEACKNFMENYPNVVKGTQYDLEKPIQQNSGSISCSFEVIPAERTTFLVSARVTPADDGSGIYYLDFVFDGSNAYGRDGDLVDTSEYFQVFDMYGMPLSPAGNIFSEGCTKQVYAFGADGYYELVIGEQRKRILFNHRHKNSFVSHVPRAEFI